MVVKKKKIKPSQVAVLLAALALYVCGGFFLYSHLHPKDTSISKIDFCSDLITEVNKDVPKAVLVDFSLQDHTMKADFKYASDKVAQNEDWLALADSVRTSVTRYLQAHSEHRLLTENWTIILCCPGIIYTNRVDEKNTGAVLGSVTFEKGTDLYTAAGFLKKIASAGDFEILTIEDEEAVLDAKTDVLALSQIPSLKKIYIKVKVLDEDVRKQIESMGITLVVPS